MTWTHLSFHPQNKVPTLKNKTQRRGAVAHCSTRWVAYFTCTSPRWLAVAGSLLGKVIVKSCGILQQLQQVPVKTTHARVHATDTPADEGEWKRQTVRFERSAFLFLFPFLFLFLFNSLPSKFDVVTLNSGQHLSRVRRALDPAGSHVASVVRHCIATSCCYTYDLPKGCL